jgi:tRNA-dihydrouridine synthase
MEGITGYVYRNLHRAHFGGVTHYYMPFVSANQSRKFSRKEWQDICPEHNGFSDLVPQILGKTAEDFTFVARELHDLGYGEINFNLGCPSGTVTAKGKGAGFLAHPSELDAFLDAVFSALDFPISIKTRLGVNDPAEFDALLEIFNKYPIYELTIHPRVRRDFYKHPARREAFARAVERCRVPLCYNGDLMTRQDCADFAARFPTVRGLMLGRGLAADPALFAPEKHTKAALHAFDEALFEGYRQMFGNDRNAMMRMKEVWFYHIHLFDDHDRLAKRLRRTTDAAEYRALVSEVYDTLPLRDHARQEW